MIPLSLQVRNFLCYRDNVPRLDFEGMHVVCLSGDNGNGKSALLDAITWALWGKARARDDELIHFGRTEMDVEFEFQFGRNRYRVIRKRTLKSGARRVQSVPTLEFQVFDQGKYQTITGNSVQETQRKIIDVLRMDYDTFVNSAFLRQGRADEFTVKDPGERKKVLADILGLGFYDELEARAREAARKCELELRELASAVREIDSQVARRPQFEKDLEQVRSEVNTLQVAVGALESEIGALESRRNELEHTRRRSLDLQARIEQARRELVEIESQAKEHQRRIAECEGVLAAREEIEKRYSTLCAARAEDEDLARKLSELMALKDRENALDRAIAEARNALLSDRKVCLSSISTAQQRASQLPILERDLAHCLDGLQALDGLGEERDAQRERVQSCRSQIELLRAVNTQLTSDMKSLKEKIDLLSRAGASCPLCETDLGPAGRDRIVSRFTEEGRSMGDTYRENSSRIKTLEAEIQSSTKRISEIENRMQEREVLQRRAAALEKSIADAHEAEGQLALLQEQLRSVEDRINAESYAESERVALEEVRAQMRRLGYDAERHRHVRALISDLRDAEDRLRKLEAARTQIDEAQSALARALKAEERWQKALDEDREAYEGAGIQLRELPEVERKLQEAQRNLDVYVSRQSDARQRLGRAEQMLSHCDYLDRQRAEKVRAQQKLSEEKSIYDELALAFGKKGIQAMIIESAIPEIEEEANALLARMTDNRLHVTLETQREAKSRDSVIETLDIRISDELGSRGYETFSGGEAFRVNFALRIALSKLLARRAGARLQTLVIDEGFGTQDAFGRDRLVEAINSIRDDFERIIVITHIQELKDAFPTRIDVIKDADGAQLIISAN